MDKPDWFYDEDTGELFEDERDIRDAFASAIWDSESFEEARKIYNEAKLHCPNDEYDELRSLEYIFVNEAYKFRKDLSSVEVPEAVNAINALAELEKALERLFQVTWVGFGDVNLLYTPGIGWTYPDGNTWLASTC